jgi:hypothetical protein
MFAWLMMCSLNIQHRRQNGTLYGDVELAHVAQHTETSFTAGTIKGSTYLYDFDTIADNTLVSFCFESM